MNDAAQSTGTVLTIDLDAVAENYRTLAKKAVAAACSAVVKADAYGLGAAHVAPKLWQAGCRAFFVAHLGEGLTVRNALPDAAIYILNGAAPGAEAALAEARLAPVLNDPGAIDRWAACARERNERLPAILHIDTGMSRLGLTATEWQTVSDDRTRLDGLTIEYLMSHLAVAEDTGHPLNQEQRTRFETARTAWSDGPASLANSAGIFLGTEYHYDQVRPGSALYGVNPTPSAPNPMRGAVTLQAPILQVRTIDSPMTVGYGATHRVSGPTKIATIAIGYADGYLRSSSNRGHCVLAGRTVPVVGRVSMDLVTLDVSEVPDTDTRPGTLVDVISNAHPVDAVAKDAGTIGYEILTSLGRRYTRRYIGNAAAETA